MPSTLLVSDMIDVVRDQIDESATISITDDAILKALNRAQVYAVDLMQRHYPDPLLANVNYTTTGGTYDEYDIPSQAFHGAILFAEIIRGSIAYPLKRISYKDTSRYTVPTQTNLPTKYSIVGRKFRVYPPPVAGLTMRVWYLRDARAIVHDQGRIALVGANYITVDSIGSTLTTASDNLNSYINIVSPFNGAVRSSHQIASIAGNRITIRNTPTRASVLGETITGTLASDVAADDMVCVVSGVCVPEIQEPFTNYMIQKAVYDIKRRLGEDVTAELAELKDMEKNIERMWAAKDLNLRVRKASVRWANHQAVGRTLLM